VTTVDVHVVRVFVDPSGDFGNALGIVDGAQVPDEARLGVAAALGYSETVFVDDPATGRLRIFSATAEMPFAGHPTVGVAWWLQSQGYDTPVLRVPVGEVPVSRSGDIISVQADPAWGSTFTWYELATPDAVLAADPAAYPDDHSYLWSWISEADGTIRSRMFAPAMGVPEDEATGSAATQLTARLGRPLHITQGAGSQLLTAVITPTAVTVGGRVTPAPARTIAI
jgi:predicted PhzF superfamily epimerase YddE/YHI9